MLFGSTTVTLDALHCSSCPTRLRSRVFDIGGLIGTLRKSAGRCPVCSGKVFDALFTVTRESRDYGAAAKALGCASFFGPLFGLAIAGSILGSGQSGKSSLSYDLRNVEGAVILEKMEGPVEGRVEWIVSIVKDSVRANLADNQGLCLECGEVFVRNLAGHTTEGYCSPICRKKHQKESAATDCPTCGRKVKTKPGGRCLFCGTPF